MTETHAERNARLRYQMSDKGRETARRRNARPEEVAKRRAYAASPEGRAAGVRSKNRKRDSIRIVAESKGCLDCGTLEELHFHHRDPATKFMPVTRMAGLSWARIEAEMAKCDVLCASCHRAKHAAH